MTEQARIEKDGIWSCRWDKDAQEHRKERPRQPWTLLRCGCEVADGVTLRAAGAVGEV
jgi:hypothetical protein